MNDKDKLNQMLRAKGLIVKDIENENGRFVTVRVNGNPAKVAWDLQSDMQLQFPRGYVSKAPTSWGQGKYSIQLNSKRPAFVHSGCTYPAGAFGVSTDIYLVR